VRAVKEQKIKNAVILSAIGSVRNYQVHQVGNREFPPKDVFVKNPTAPADIIGMSGFVMVIAAVVNSVALPVLIAFTRRGFPGASRITRGISDRSGSRIPS
jgi:hypothetical protein